MSTVAAISTPSAVGGISLIRISGEKAIAVAEQLFVPYGNKTLREMPGHTCAYGKIVSHGEPLDDVLLTVFRAPKSYTGEDIIEISCHGGLYVTRKILREIISLGAEPAGAGEFTKRAFLNGKISLTQAEAVADIISAEGEAALSSANLMREGALFKDIRGVTDCLLDLLSALAAWTDYPDEDLPETDPTAILQVLQDAKDRLMRIIKNYDSGRIFREGIDCVIVGRPNVGKSTLYNALLGFERSIVTPLAGTTRDIVEESLKLGDVVLRLSDTAGIRDTENEVEKLGVQLAERALDRAQLIFAVFDGSEELNADDLDILQKIRDRKHIVIINKGDLPQKINKEYIQSKNILEVSAKSSNGLDALKDAVYKMFMLDGYIGHPEVFANERQKVCCDKALGHLGDAETALLAGETLDAVTVCLDSAADALLELTGEKATVAVVDRVFERFCVGK